MGPASPRQATSGVNLTGSKPVMMLANKSSAPPTGKVTNRCKTLILLLDMEVSESFSTVLIVILIFFVCVQVNLKAVGGGQ